MSLSMTDREHRAFLNYINNPTIMDRIKTLSPHFRENVKKESRVWKSRGDKKGAKFLDWIYRETAFEHYLIVYPQTAIFGFYPLNWKATIVFGFMWASEVTSKYLRGYDENIEITGLHSVQKGEAYKLMKKLIAVGKELDLPILLWCETDKLVKYYERYGFMSFGRIGKDKEYLMILFPNEGGL